MRRFSKLILVAILACIGEQAYAERLFFQVWPCENGGTSYTSGFRDDDTGLQYAIHVDCFGNTCMYPLIGPYPRTVSTGDWIAPSNLKSLLDAAGTITEPGADVGLYMIGSANGDTLRFRNLTDADERQAYLMMWLNERSKDQTTTYPEHDVNLSDMLIRTYRETYARMSQEERMISDLIGEYWNARYKEGEYPEGRAEREDVTTVAAELARAKSNIYVKQAPSKATDYQLIIIPVTPLLLGEVNIYNTDGQVVWSGSLQNEVMVSMNSMPSGMYFIRGKGVDIPLQLVR